MYSEIKVHILLCNITLCVQKRVGIKNKIINHFSVLATSSEDNQW